MNDEANTTGGESPSVELAGAETVEKIRKHKFATRKSELEKRLDKRVIRRMAYRGCTIVEIAEVCQCAVSTLKTPKWHKIIKRQRSKLKSGLRLAQISVAIKDKNVPMLIHLGKHYLDQRDQVDQRERPSLNIVFVDGKVNGKKAQIVEAESHSVGLQLPEPLPEHE